MKITLAIILQGAIGSSLPLYSEPDVHTLEEIPFKYAAGHIITVPVKVCGEDCTFILDTGCGVNVVSERLVQKYSCKGLGKHSGKRMSGQQLTMDMFKLPSLQVGSNEQQDVPVASWKMEEILGDAPELKDVQGMVSLDFFKNTAFTMDYQNQAMFIESPVTVKKRAETGTSVPIRITQRSGVETSISLPISFTNGTKAIAEVDTGSGNLILDTKYMKLFGIDPSSKDVKTVNGTDETKHSYVRYFTQLPVSIFPGDADKLIQNQPNVHFQKIIYDGLVGDSFLKQFTVTYDLPGKRMILQSQQEYHDGSAPPGIEPASIPGSGHDPVNETRSQPPGLLPSRRLRQMVN
jgi:hypothetical protein